MNILNIENVSSCFEEANSRIIFETGNSRPLFLILVFSMQLTVNKCWIYTFPDDWFRTGDPWWRKQPLYQLSRNHYQAAALFSDSQFYLGDTKVSIVKQVRPF